MGGDIKEIVYTIYTICELCRVSIVEDCDVSSYAAVNGIPLVVEVNILNKL
jgi:hypothetical protein